MLSKAPKASWPVDAVGVGVRAPLQGSGFFRTLDPGRCSGLSHFAPLGRSSRGCCRGRCSERVPWVALSAVPGCLGRPRWGAGGERQRCGLRQPRATPWVGWEVNRCALKERRRAVDEANARPASGWSVPSERGARGPWPPQGLAQGWYARPLGGSGAAIHEDICAGASGIIQTPNF